MIFKIIKYAYLNSLRNTFLSISSIVILTLLMFFINVLLVAHNVSFRIISSVNEKLTISLYLNEEYDANSLEVIDFQKDLLDVVPSLDMKYKNKDEVLEELRQSDPDLVNILERQNPLPETITLEEIPLASYEQLNTVIESRMYLLANGSDEAGNYFSNYSQQFERIQGLISVLRVLQAALYIIIATFVVSMAVIIYSIIGNFIYYYRDEIYITQLVGGSRFFIYGPFSAQGALYVVVSFVMSSALFLFLASTTAKVLGYSGFSGIYIGNFFVILLLEAIMFLCIGILSGWVSSRRYLQKK